MTDWLIKWPTDSKYYCSQLHRADITTEVPQRWQCKLQCCVNNSTVNPWLDYRQKLLHVTSITSETWCQTRWNLHNKNISKDAGRRPWSCCHIKHIISTVGKKNWSHWHSQGDHALNRRQGAHLPHIGVWACRYVDRLLSLWCMASATLDLPSQPQSITAFWPEPIYTAGDRGTNCHQGYKQLAQSYLPSYCYYFSCTSVFQQYFSLNKSFHNYDTRNQSLQLSQHQSRHGFQTLKFKGSQLWNRLPSDLQETASPPVFRQLLKYHLLYNPM